MRRVWPIWAAIFLGVAACVAVILDEASHGTALGFVDGVMNSDTLWPASFFWDVTTRADGWRGHSLSRLPSLIPDLAVWGTFLAITHSVRWTVLLYAVAQYSAFVAIGGWLAARLAGRAWVVGTTAVFAVTAIVIALALARIGGRIMVFSALLPIIHVGPMLLALLAASLAARFSAGVRSAWAIVGVSMTVFLSDQLLLIEFVLPLLFASVVLCAVGRMRPSRLMGNAIAVFCGMLVGLILFNRLRHAGVQVDHTPEMTVEVILASARKFLADIPHVVADVPIFSAVVAVAALAFAGLGVWIVVRVTRLPARLAADDERLFLWLFAAGTLAGDLVFAACFYDNAQSLRYWVALWAWGVVALAAAALRVPGAAYATAPVAALTAGVAVFEFAVVDRGSVGLLHWDQDVAACVRAERGPLDLHAGLAQYWIARPAEVALRWSTQIDQITQIGLAYPWNSDAKWFRESFADPSRPPVYDFIVMRNLDPDGILARYGKPDQVVPCADTAIWVYHDRSAIYPKLAATLPPEPAPH